MAFSFCICSVYSQNAELNTVQTENTAENSSEEEFFQNETFFEMAG